MRSHIRCDGIRRRDVIRIGGLSAFGLGLGSFFRLRRSCGADPASKTTATSCILIWLDGGPSHIETFDPKPDAPAEVRGPFAAIGTNVAGIRIGECFERTSQMMERFAIVRSMTSRLGEHNFGTHYLMTGYEPTPALEYPAIGATVAHLRGRTDILPPFVSVPGFSGSVSGHGFLPQSAAPFIVSKDFAVPDLDFYQGLDLTRIDRRREIVDALDRFSLAQDAAASKTSDPDFERAYNLIASSDAKRAFNLDEEPTEIRERYGRGGGNGIGEACLLARRLVERGVPFVTVNAAGWDTHQNISQLKERYPGDRSAHLPSLDRALSGLVSDLAERNILDQTLVIVMGEFGRTPKINSAGGRDHWPNVFSVALAGGGVRGGQVIGSSDALGEFPKDDPTTPSDLAATIFTLLGIDPNTELLTADGRPVRVAPDGSKVVTQLLA